jgi:hypothetical protein
MYVRTEQYTHIDRNCPIRTDLHPADDAIEVALGESRFGDSTLRLVVTDPDTCRYLADAFYVARDQLLNHLYAKTNPALPQLDTAR